MIEMDQGAPRTREELVDRLSDLREQGVLDLTEEARLLQHYDEMLRDVEEEKARLEPEYDRRCEADGKDAADAWLAEAARDLGRRHGEATRRVTDQFPVGTR